MGELYLGGDGVARGYWRRPELTEAKFVWNPSRDVTGRWYRTGDRVRALEDGALEFLDRTDDQVKIRGFRVEPGEITARLKQKPGVRDAVVIVKGSGNDKYLAGYVVPAAISTSAADERAFTDALVRSLCEELPEFMTPKAWVLLDVLPLNPNGKIDRGRLPEPSWDSSAEYVSPRTETERRLAKIWEKILNRDQIGVNAGFFDVGGHSLLATRVMSAVQAEFLCPLTIRDVFVYQTIADLAACIDALIDTDHIQAAAADAEAGRSVEIVDEDVDETDW